MWQDWRFLIAAGVLHLALPAAAAIAPAPDPLRFVYASVRERGEIDVDVDTAILPPQSSELERAMPLGTARQPRDPSRPLPPADPNRPPAPMDTSDPLDEPPPNPGEVLLAEPDAPGDVFDEYNLPPSPGDLYAPGTPGIGPSGPIWQQYPGVIPPDGPGPLPAPTSAPRKTYDRGAATKVIQDSVRAKDRKLGLDFPGRGPIRAAFVSAVYGSDAPYDCSASFSLMVDRNGKVTTVTLGGYAGGDSSTWQAVLKSAKAQLAAATLPMKSAFAKGALVGVNVRSQLKMPGGGTSRDGATISFDVTDLGAKETRVVTAAVSARPIE